MALVANRAEGTVSVFRIKDGTTVVPAGKVEIGPVSSEVSHVAFTPDGRHALVTRYGDHMVNVLQIENEKVTKTNREITTGVRPYGLSITPDGRWAVVANLGRGTGDADTVSLIDLGREPWRIVDTVSVGQMPEGIQASPDSRFVAVTVMNGSNKPPGSPFHGPGLVRMLRDRRRAAFPRVGGARRHLVAGRRLLPRRPHAPRRQHGGARGAGAARVGGRQADGHGHAPRRFRRLGGAPHLGGLGPPRRRAPPPPMRDRAEPSD